MDLLTSQRTAERLVFHRRGHLVGPDGKPIPIKTFDISAGGIGLLSPDPLVAKQLIALNVFTLHNAVPELMVKGVVAYCMLSGTQGYRVGLQYIDVPSQVKSLINQISAHAR
jgi:c-di-GMP-binding flagellar brake protein YcgR